MSAPSFDGLRLSSGAALVVRGKASEEDWAAANKRWSQRSETNPFAVISPAITEDVQAVVRFATAHKLKLAVRGGGHSQWDSNGVNDGIIIDLGRMRQVKLADDKQSVSVGGGARWLDVYQVTDEAGVAVVGAGWSDVGVGGFVTGAGYSVLSGLYGLGCDNVIAAMVVLASGEAVACSAEKEKDLFWAIRGGSSNFGVVTEFRLNAFKHPGPVLIGALVYKGDDRKAAWKAVNVRPSELIAFAVAKDAQHFVKHRQPAQSASLMLARDPREGKPVVMIGPFLPTQSKEAVQKDATTAPLWDAKPVADMTQVVPNLTATVRATDPIIKVWPRRTVGGFELLDPSWIEDEEAFEAIWTTFVKASEGLRGAQAIFYLHHPDKIASFPKDHTAFHAGGRRPHFSALLLCGYPDESVDVKAKDFIAQISQQIRKDNKRLSGIDFPLSGNGVEEHEPIERVYGNHLERLKRIKDHLDPERVFSRWHPL